MNENEIECTRCGAAVYYELNECPECGLNFYLPEEDDWQETWTAEETDSGLSLGGVTVVGVLSGWFAASLVLLVFQLVGNLLNLFRQPLYFSLLLLASGIAAGFVGGFLAGWLSHDKHLTAALIVGIFTILTALLFEAFYRDLAAESLLRPGFIFTGIVTLLAALGGGVVTRNRALRVDDGLFANEEELYHELMIKISYDRALAERLIAYESQRSPNAARPIWIRSAITRWERDNRL